MSDCRPNWYKNYSLSLQNWTDGKSDYRVAWKDNEGTEHRYATFATDYYDAILRCSMAHPLVVSRIVEVHVFSSRDLMTLEPYTDRVENLMVAGHGYKLGVTSYFPNTIAHQYNAGSTPEEAVDKLMYEIEYADERNMTMQERPTKGYKAVIRYNEFRWYVLEMDIPEDATLVDSGNGFYRTDKAMPIRFLSTRFKSAIIDKSAHSWYSIDFDYTPGVLAKSRLDLSRHTDCAAGIHFFETFEQAKNWGNANFGMPAAM